MYEFRIATQGKFTIYNTTRKKEVFAGTDKKLKEKKGKTYKFKNVEDIMSNISSWVSLATFKKISKKLCAW
jgi:hypothetical protein